MAAHSEETTMPTEEPIATVAPGDGAEKARHKLVLGILIVSAFVVILNETIMAVALPRLMTALGVSANAAQWLSTAFMLTMAVVIPITGYLLERFETRTIFITAMTLFSTGTALAAASPDLLTLIAARIVQASGTAIMMPLLMTTLMTLVPPAERGRTMGNVSIVISVAPAVGPTISGVILHFLDWRWTFLLVLPIALAALILGGRRIENVSSPRKAPLDVLSIPLAVLGFGGIVYGLSSFGNAAADPATTWLPLGVGIGALLLFLLRQLRLQGEDRALLDLRTFTFPAFSIAVLMMAVAMMALLGVIILLPIYTQNVLGLDALETGLMMLPGGLLMALLAPFVGRIYDKRGPAPLVRPGAGLVSLVLFFLGTVTETTAWPLVLAAHMLVCAGLALLFTPLFTAGLGALPARLYAHGSAVLGSVQQVAGAAGTALFVALMSLRAASLSAEGLAAEPSLAAGIRLAFQYGAALSLITIVAAFFIKKPAEHPL
jgi:DHA2 family lincomycin resistance protein-like MFS transporter